MTSMHPLAHAAVSLALSAIASVAHANDKTTTAPNPVDADAIVPATMFQSALQYRPAQADASSPAQNWLALNQLVSTYDAMSLTTDEPAATHPAAAPADPHAHHKQKAAK